MALETPCKPRSFHEWGRRREGITALSAEEMSYVPFSAASDHDFAFNRGLATPASRTKQFVEVKMTIEPHQLGLLIIGCCVCESISSFRCRLLVKCDAFQRGTAVMACEALGVEA